MYECHICQQGHMTTGSLTTCLKKHSDDRLAGLEARLSAEQKLNADLEADLEKELPTVPPVATEAE